MSTTLDPSTSLVRASIITHRRKQDGPRTGGHHMSDGLHLFGGAASIHDTPSTAASAPSLDQAHMRRPSSSSTNFPSNGRLRSPPPPVDSTPSPSDTPPLAADATPAKSSASSASQPPSLQSPWHALAASGGAMTPSLERPSLAPRGSPQLRQPFERLNLDGLEGAWSVSNLRQDTIESTIESPHRAPGPAVVPSGAISGGGRRTSLGAPISLESSLAQRRATGASISLGSLGGGPPVTPSPLTAAASGSTPGSTSPSSSTATSTSTAGASTSRLKPLAASSLPSLLAADSTLVLDVRPPSCYQTSHLPVAHLLTVPSMLMLRPTFGTSKLLPMLAAEPREAVSRWRDKSDIIFVDQDSTVALEGGVLLGVSSKFEREGFTGRLWYISGGQTALDCREDIACVATNVSVETNTSTPESSGSLGIGRLPRLAFQQSSTGRAARGLNTAAASQRGDPFQALSQPLGSAPATDRRQGRSKLQPANPFFDNIRQNLELSHGGITERISLALPDAITLRANELPKFLRNLVCMNDTDSQDVLADQFYRLERDEQERLQSVMNVLSQGSRAHSLQQSSTAGDILCADEVERLMADGANQSSYFPFSITAGVERGTKNRYKNIWPFDYSRVRLVTPADDNSDYINASFVQPRGTTRRYIATQGPLDSTYREFWSLVWEQNVRVIVMLTRQFEGGLLKCGNYWQEQQYGELSLRQVSQSGGEDEAQQIPTTGFDFGPAATAPSQPGSNIHRTFELWHNGCPDQPPRVVTQIQCVDWPDFDVPESPEVLLNLMKEVDTAVAKTGLTGCGEDRCEFPPVLVHCSAGVGRTGSYILVDAISDGLRRELRDEAAAATDPLAGAARNGSIAEKVDKMDVDAMSDSNARSPEPEKPRPITQSHKPHRVATPLSSLKEPILEVLQSMRVQRMSLVQSLRQYLFVHRSVIANYVEMVDDQARRRSSASDAQSVLSRSSAATAATSVSASDDESHIKRKPSSADLQPEVDTRLHSVADLRLSEVTDGAVNLAKRASFKKRRGPNASSVPGTPHSAGSATSGSAATVTSPPLPSSRSGSTTITSPPSMSPGLRRGRRE